MSITDPSLSRPLLLGVCHVHSGLARPDRGAQRLVESRIQTLTVCLDDAVPSAIRMQERAGLDYISDGEWRRESYVKVFHPGSGRLH